MTTATETFERIEAAAKATAPSLRVIYKMQVGDVVRQGDLYLELLAGVPKKHGKRTTNAQLAIGETQGSRHVIDPRPTGLEVFSPPAGATALEGPIVVSRRERIRLTHPEHGNFDLPPGVYRVTYQRDFAKERAQELRRVAD